MALPVQMAIGAYRFQVSTAAYQQLQRKYGWRWTKVDRAARAPAMQYVGPALQEMTFDGTIYPHERGGWQQIEAMRKEADKHQPLPLVSGFGEVFGDFVILTIQETLSRFLIGNAAGRIDFTMSIQEYVRDPSEGGR